MMVSEKKSMKLFGITLSSSPSVIKMAFLKKELSTSQKQAVIKLIKKRTVTKIL